MQRPVALGKSKPQHVLKSEDFPADWFPITAIFGSDSNDPVSSLILQLHNLSMKSSSFLQFCLIISWIDIGIKRGGKCIYCDYQTIKISGKQTYTTKYLTLKEIKRKTKNNNDVL